VVELDRDRRFRTPRVRGGQHGASLRIDRGAWMYRVRCAGAGAGAPLAAGRIAVLRDAGTRSLPRARPPNDIEADGRIWRVSYQSAIPDLRVAIRGAGAQFRVSLAQGGRAEVFTAGSSPVTIPGARLREGTYTYWAEVDGARQPRVSTLILDFDQTAAQVYIESPIDGAEWGSDLDVRGAVLAGWSASIDALELPLDSARRFAARVGAPADRALAIRVAHPQRGIHYYLRHARGVAPR
jgi:hypothetical protein